LLHFGPFAQALAIRKGAAWLNWAILDGKHSISARLAEKSPRTSDLPPKSSNYKFSVSADNNVDAYREFVYYK
jgi:hypothetical protein